MRTHVLSTLLQARASAPRSAGGDRSLINLMDLMPQPCTIVRRYRAGLEVSTGSRRASALLAARTSSHEPSRCQSIILVILHDARSKPPARARRNWSAQWLKRTSAQTLSARTRWLSRVDATSNIERRTTLARDTKPVPTAETTAMQRRSRTCSRQQLRHLAPAAPWKDLLSGRLRGVNESCPCCE